MLLKTPFNGLHLVFAAHLIVMTRGIGLALRKHLLSPQFLVGTLPYFVPLGFGPLQLFAPTHPGELSWLIQSPEDKSTPSCSS